MERPKVIVLMAASVDGRVALRPNMTMFDSFEQQNIPENNLWQEIEDQLMVIHKPQMNMLGSGTLIKEGEKLRDLGDFEANHDFLYEDYLPEEILHRPGHKGWLGVVDGRGRFRNAYKGSDENLTWHSLHMVSKGVEPAYLNFLRRQKIPYLISGQKRVDLKAMMKKVKDKLGVASVLVTGGGKLTGAMLRAACVDEVNIIVQPHLIGGQNTPTLFEATDLNPEDFSTPLDLVSAQIYGDGFLWLRYKVKE